MNNNVLSWIANFIWGIADVKETSRAVAGLLGKSWYYELPDSSLIMKRADLIRHLELRMSSHKEAQTAQMCFAHRLRLLCFFVASLKRARFGYTFETKWVYSGPTLYLRSN